MPDRRPRRATPTGKAPTPAVANAGVRPAYPTSIVSSCSSHHLADLVRNRCRLATDFARSAGAGSCSAADWRHRCDVLATGDSTVDRLSAWLTGVGRAGCRHPQPGPPTHGPSRAARPRTTHPPVAPGTVAVSAGAVGAARHRA